MIETFYFKTYILTYLFPVFKMFSKYLFLNYVPCKMFKHTILFCFIAVCLLTSLPKRKIRRIQTKKNEDCCPFNFGWHLSGDQRQEHDSR